MAGQRGEPSSHAAPLSVDRNSPTLLLRWPGEVAELVAAGDAEFRVRAVQVGSNGARGQEEAVGDLCVGEAVAGEDDDFALLRGELGECVAGGRGGRFGNAAGAQFRLGAPGPGCGAQAAE